MQLNTAKKEKEIIVSQLKEDLTTLGVTEVGIPASADDFTVNDVSTVGSNVDSGNDQDIKPNTSVKVSFTDTDKSDKTHQTTMNYRRLDLKFIKEKAEIQETDGYEVKVHGKSDADNKLLKGEDYRAKLNPALVSKLKVCTDSSLNASISTSKSTLDKLTQGICVYGVSPKEDSLTLTLAGDPLDFKVKVIEDNEIAFFATNYDGKVLDSASNSYVYTSENKLKTAQPSGFTYLDNSHFIGGFGKEITALDMTWFETTTGSSVNLHTLLPESITEIKGYTNPGRNDRVSLEIKPNYGEEKRVYLKHVNKISGNLFRYLRFNTDRGEESFNTTVLGNENTVIEDVKDFEDFNLNVNNHEVHIPSLQAGLVILRLGSSNRSNYKVTKNFTEGQTDTNNDTYGKVLISNAQPVYFTNDERETLVIEESAANSKIKEVILPKTLKEIPASFLNKANLTSPLTIGEEVAVKANAFKGATISKLVFKGEKDKVLPEEGAFGGATITEIVVKNQEVKDKVEPLLNTLANTPSWTIEETSSTSSPVTPGEVPSTVVSEGLEYGS